MEMRRAELLGPDDQGRFSAIGPSGMPTRMITRLQLGYSDLAAVYLSLAVERGRPISGGRSFDESFGQRGEHFPTLSLCWGDGLCFRPIARLPPRPCRVPFRDFVGGQRGCALRAELAQRHPRLSPEEIEDAVQGACERFVETATEVTEPGQVYTWIRTTAHRLLNEQDERGTREIAVDPIEGVLEQAAASSDADPAEEVIAREETDEMEALVREVTDSLSERRREILALYVAGCKRPRSPSVSASASARSSASC